MKTRNRRRSAHAETARGRRRLENILIVGLALGTVGAFLVDGLTGHPAASGAGNVAATLLGILLLLRRG